jgi:hypothetical protein
MSAWMVEKKEELSCSGTPLTQPWFKFTLTSSDSLLATVFEVKSWCMDSFGDLDRFAFEATDINLVHIQPHRYFDHKTGTMFSGATGRWELTVDLFSEDTAALFKLRWM